MIFSLSSVVLRQSINNLEHKRHLTSDISGDRLLKIQKKMTCKFEK